MITHIEFHIGLQIYTHFKEPGDEVQLQTFSLNSAGCLVNGAVPSEALSRFSRRVPSKQSRVTLKDMNFTFFKARIVAANPPNPSVPPGRFFSLERNQ